MEQGDYHIIKIIPCGLIRVSAVKGCISLESFLWSASLIANTIYPLDYPPLLEAGYPWLPIQFDFAPYKFEVICKYSGRIYRNFYCGFWHV